MGGVLGLKARSGYRAFVRDDRGCFGYTCTTVARQQAHRRWTAAELRRWVSEAVAAGNHGWEVGWCGHMGCSKNKRRPMHLMWGACTQDTQSGTAAAEHPRAAGARWKHLQRRRRHEPQANVHGSSWPSAAAARPSRAARR
jgi:hypothetical protein